MEDRPFFRRLVSIEVLAGAVVGAGLPYLIAWISEIAPTRVPLGLVALSVGGGALMGWTMLRVISGYQTKAREMREAGERRDRERAEMRMRLEEIEHAVTAMAPTRSLWPKRRR
jgi:hypothetical protein